MGGWVGGRTAKTSNFLQTSDLAMIMNTLDNSDDTISQTKLYQAAVSFYLSTFRSNSIQLNLKNKQTKNNNTKPTTLADLLPNFENCQICLQY